MDSIGSFKKKIAQELSEKINLTLREAELEAQFIMQYVLKESSSNLIIKRNEIVIKNKINPKYIQNGFLRLNSFFPRFESLSFSTFQAEL